MWGVVCWVSGCLIILETTAAHLLYRSGRRVCSSGAVGGSLPVTQSFVEGVHKPLLTTCEGHRVCSTYRTWYRISYRQVSKPLLLYTCCPGWGDTHSCHKASCSLPCQNGGTCTRYNQCRCSHGWSGNHCQTDVDECSSAMHRCSQSCINTSGSFRCGCYEGFHLSDDGRSCYRVEKTTSAPQTAVTGEGEAMRQEIRDLRSKMEALEQKMHLVLAPFDGLQSVAPVDKRGPVSFLTHSLQQLDRIDSLSEQISFLEERLETCSCKSNL